MTENRQPEKSFWDINQYRKTIKRIENGHKSCDDFVAMIQERADLEMRYTKSLRRWAEKWEEAVTKGPEYGTTLLAWKHTLQEAVQIAKVHEECRCVLTAPDGPLQNVQRWKKENYHKLTFGGYQEIRDAEEGFAVAQKDYSKQLNKTKKVKKNYHSACSASFKADEELASQTHSTTIHPDNLKKLQQRAEKMLNVKEKYRELYLRRLLECHGELKQRYIEDMTEQFEKCQSFEKKRLDHLKEQLLLFLKSVDLSEVSGFANIYNQTFRDVEKADAITDLSEWRVKYGTGMTQNWPVFEDFDANTDARRFSVAPRKNCTADDGNDNGDDFDSDDFENEEDEGDIMADDDVTATTSYANDHPYDTTDSHSLYDNVTPRSNIAEEQTETTPYDETQPTPSTTENKEYTELSVRALYDFEPASGDELQLQAGDIFSQIGAAHEDGWAYGRLRDAFGLFPASYVEPL